MSMLFHVRYGNTTAITSTRVMSWPEERGNGVEHLEATTVAVAAAAAAAAATISAATRWLQLVVAGARETRGEEIVVKDLKESRLREFGHGGQNRGFQWGGQLRIIASGRRHAEARKRCRARRQLHDFTGHLAQSRRSETRSTFRRGSRETLSAFREKL